MKNILLKFLKVTGISIAAVLLVLFLAPIIFPGTVTEKIKEWTNSSLEGELNFSKVRLSFFHHFPSLTVTLHNFTLKGSAPFKKDTLVSASEIALGVNLKSLIFEKNIRINKIFISDANIRINVNEKGEANYNVYNSGKKKSNSSSNDSSGTALMLEKIIVENSHLTYNDRSIPVLINASGFNYEGSGDLSKAIFDLQSMAKIDALDFTLNNEPYLINKKIQADLITRVNTHSLSFIFQKNKLHINKLPVDFEGKLDFLSNGYDIDFTVSSIKSDLHDVLTALPPQYLNWLQKTKVQGRTDTQLRLKGKYIASSNLSPNLNFSFKISDGAIAYQGAPLAADHLLLNLELDIPSLAPDSMAVRLDSLSFMVGKDYFKAFAHTRGFSKPMINLGIDANLDLEKLDQAIGFENMDLKGKFHAVLNANGIYATGPNPKSLRHESIVVSIPAFKLESHLQNGYFKYYNLPEPIGNISFDLTGTCANNDYQNTGFNLSNISASTLSNFIKGHISINPIKERKLDASLQASINLSDIKKMVPLDSFQLFGLLKLDINSNGRLDPAHHSFPTSTAEVLIKDGSIKTPYYPNAIDHIQVALNATDKTGTLKDLMVTVQPATFQFEGKPFNIETTLNNFEDLHYKMKLKGELDLSRIYKVFARKGTELSGFIKADLSLEGNQHDALMGNYNNLHNQGVLELNAIHATHENFPQPFIIKKGVFTFKQDKVWFNNFLAGYGQSDFNLNGYLQNVIEYAVAGKGNLTGNFTVTSNSINADEFMAFSGVGDSPTVNKSGAVNSSDKGVIIIPSNLDLTVNANARNVFYNGLALKDTKATLLIQLGKLSLKETGFNLIGCKVNMNASYGSISPVKAWFDYQLQANDFDIRKAYMEVKLFHDMASAAGKAQGIVSIDYALKGKLDGNMHPIYPSLEGGGVLSVKNVKLAGLKLFNVVAKKTGKDSVSNPDLNKVDIKTTVKNNIITIERFKFKVAGFRPRIEGQTSFDGKLNLKMRLGLPPLGIIGIPMRITGTQDNPKVKIGKGGEEEIPETEEKDK